MDNDRSPETQHTSNQGHVASYTDEGQLTLSDITDKQTCWLINWCQVMMTAVERYGWKS